MKSKSLKEDIEDLKDSTVRLGKQLSDMASGHLADSSKAMHEINKGVLKSMNHNMRALREKANAIADSTVVKSKKLDKTMHAKPYWFLAAAFGIGLVLGKFYDRRRSQHFD
jgi:ElaB/YqjD/DUF883 family membrane-anchored ribosome-binding protein